MTPPNMTALLSALKAKEVPPALSESEPDAAPAADDAPDGTHPEDDDASPEMNQKIVDVLQSQYPRIYQKIFSMVDNDDADADPSDANPSDPAKAGGGSAAYPAMPTG